MKRIVTLILSVTMIIGSLALSAFAAEKPAGAAEGSNVSELVNTTTAPDMTKLISQGLLSSQNCSVKGILDANWKGVDIKDEILPDIGNQFKYGFSVWGAGRLQKYAQSAVDGIWTTGNHGAKVESDMAGMGAFTWYKDDQIYNVNNQSVAIESEDAYKNGYIYEMLITFNFGKIAELDSFGYVTTNYAAMHQAADIYVSDNGKDWTLVGYFDRNQLLIDEKEFNELNGSVLGADGTGNAWDATGSNKAVIFELPEGTKGQFLRIAATCGNAMNNNVSAGYGTNLRPWNDYGETAYQTFRELMVFGTLTNDVGYTYQEGDGDVTTVPTTGDDTGASEEETTLKIPSKVDKDTTVDEETTVPTAVTTDNSAATTDDKGDDKGGCASTAGIGIAVIASISAGAMMIVKRRKED